MREPVRHVRVGIIGAGFAGLGMAAQLVRHGRGDFLVVERASEVGGTWRDNSYPGAACDIRSDLYSFSFAPKPDWARRYAPQPEILEYLKSVADRFDLRPHILFNSEVLRAEWSDADGSEGGHGPTSPGRRRRFARYPALQRMSRALVFASAELRFLGFRFHAVGRVFEVVSRAFLRREVKDPTLRAQLTPDFRIGCKRILISSDYYRALSQPNVTLVTEPIASVELGGVTTADGRHRPADVLIGGTGFDATHPPIARVVAGREGVPLAARWSPHMNALHGTTVTGFPNLFLLVGPNTALGHNSIVAIIEAQLGYVLSALAELDARSAGSLEPEPTAQRAHNERLQHALRGSVWESGCANFYLDETGRNTVVWPGTVIAFRRALRRFRPDEYLWVTHH